MNNSDYAVIILTHGRHDRVYTFDSLRKSGYTGEIYLLCDDEDKQLELYKEKYKDNVLVFSKDKYAGTFDKMDNFGNKSCVVYARNAVWDFAKKLGLKYFIVVDDDYTMYRFRIDNNQHYRTDIQIKNMDSVFSAYIDFMDKTDIDTICFAQDGDYIGGFSNSKISGGYKPYRKMMNLYFFRTSRKMEFKGTINEDLTSSITEGVLGKIIITCMLTSLLQKETQSNAGGLTDIYLELGTYVKSFYSVIAAPSCVKVALMGDKQMRLHHAVTWKNAVPKIIREC